MDNPVAFSRSFILRPALFASLIEEHLVERAVNTVMSIPASSMTGLICLAIAADVIGLCGGAYDIINRLPFPVE